jgi:phosphorylcholine metabolism protein LicD
MKLKLTDEMKVVIGIIIFIGILCFMKWCIDKTKIVSKPTKKGDYEYIHKILLDNLEKTIKIFEKHNIQYWCTAGTLLGAIREGNIIEHDDDIDLGLFKDDFLKLQNNENNIQDDLNDIGLHLLINEPEFNHNKIVTKKNDNNYHINRIFIDIMSFDKEGDRYILDAKAYGPTGVGYFGNEWFYEKELLPLTTHKLSNLTINIPNNSIKYLERRYDDWKTPMKLGDHLSEINLQID